MNDSKGFQFRPAHLVIAILVIMWMVYVIRKFYRKHKDNLEPIHILQIHFYIEFVLVTLLNIFLRTYGIETSRKWLTVAIFRKWQCGIMD